MELVEALLSQLFSGVTRKNWARVLIFAVVLILAALAFYALAAGMPLAK